MAKLALVTGSRATAVTLMDQLSEYFLCQEDVVAYVVDEGIQSHITEGLVIISSQILYQELAQGGLLRSESDLIIAKRTINFDFLDQVVSLERGTPCLLVNDLMETAMEVIEDLRRIGLQHISYVPYAPNGVFSSGDKAIVTAITPGEVQSVPPWVEHIVDIGPRILDFSTLTQILSKLNILDERAGMFSQKYLQKITNVAFRLAESRNHVAELNAHLGTVLEGLNDGLLVYDDKGVITVSNENFKKLMPTKHRTHVGKRLIEIVNDRYFLDLLQSDSEYQGIVFVHQGRELLLTKQRIFHNSIMVTLKNAQDTLKENDRIKRELQQKGFVAKYSMDDIIGSSPEISRVKIIIQKLAQSQLTILITGESGTGKELIASAIHQGSSRSNGPFLAVNFSALSDELIESELFGYEEGSFTGAKRGGKAGLFEQADGGTLFLDEIGDVSLKVQTRLLRVLQENEIMRIGATEIRKVDVRIIAATHRDLNKMVQEKLFREDLFYRLKIGTIHIPPLRERKSDIGDLVKRFVKQSGDRSVSVHADVIETLESYQWFGNVRELRNTIAYMMAVKNDDCLMVSDIPNPAFFEATSNRCEKEPVANKAQLEITEEERLILSKIQSIQMQRQICGREKIALLCLDSPYPLTAYQVRYRLEVLEKKGYIQTGRGKVGTRLTPLGETVLMATK